MAIAEALPVCWRCATCHALFYLRGDLLPRLRLVGLVAIDGPTRVEIDPPAGSAWGICPSCAVERAADLSLLELWGRQAQGADRCRR